MTNDSKPVTIEGANNNNNTPKTVPIEQFNDLQKRYDDMKQKYDEAVIQLYNIGQSLNQSTVRISENILGISRISADLSTIMLNPDQAQILQEKAQEGKKALAKQLGLNIDEPKK